MRNRRGWWVVKSAEGKTMVRAWGFDLWWTPLIGGWMSSPPGYEKQRFICPMEPHDSKMDPRDEWKRAVERSGLTEAL